MNGVDYLKKALRPNGKTDFISKLPSHSSILDVGCGNNSPFRTKRILPSCNYTGIDIGEYNQEKPNLADTYIITQPNKFTEEISQFTDRFDAVISSHNLEHCNDRHGTLAAMLRALKKGGKLYLSFPCEKSIGFPNRSGTLNYYDDNTHKDRPPDFNQTRQAIKNRGFRILYESRNFQPPLLWLLGLLTEPYSAAMRKVTIGTWEFWGFETVLVAQKE